MGLFCDEDIKYGLEFIFGFGNEDEEEDTNDFE